MQIDCKATTFEEYYWLFSLSSSVQTPILKEKCKKISYWLKITENVKSTQKGQRNEVKRKTLEKGRPLLQELI